MAHFYNIRGFLDCSEEELTSIREIIRRLPDNVVPHLDAEIVSLFRTGWCFQDQTLNYVQHVFYGGNVNRCGRDLVLSDLEAAVAELPEVEGMFIADYEDDVREIWTVAGGRVHVERRAGPEAQHRWFLESEEDRDGKTETGDPS